MLTHCALLIICSLYCPVHYISFSWWPGEFKGDLRPACDHGSQDQDGGGWRGNSQVAVFRQNETLDTRFKYFQSKVDLNSCRELASGQCSIIKMEETDNPMGKTADKVAEAFVLFAQVVSYLWLKKYVYDKQGTPWFLLKTDWIMCQKGPWPCPCCTSEDLPRFP